MKHGDIQRTAIIHNDDQYRLENVIDSHTFCQHDDWTRLKLVANENGTFKIVQPSNKISHIKICTHKLQTLTIITTVNQHLHHITMFITRSTAFTCLILAATVVSNKKTTMASASKMRPSPKHSPKSEPRPGKVKKAKGKAKGHIRGKKTVTTPQSIARDALSECNSGATRNRNIAYEIFSSEPCDMDGTHFMHNVVMLNGDEPMGLVQIGCNEEVNRVVCGEACTSNDDCNLDEAFCRPTIMEGYSACVPYAETGDYCGGNMPPYGKALCKPDEDICFFQPMPGPVMDMPGTCYQLCDDATPCRHENQVCRLLESTFHGETSVCVDSE